MSQLTTPNIIETIAYHGTYEKNIASILSIGFKESKDHHMWFGDGAYFFVEGLADPMEAAYEFVTDKKNKYKIEDNVAVLEAVINVDNDCFLDLTNIQGLQLFNSYRDEILKKIKSSGKIPATKLNDFDLLSNMRENLGIEFVKGNVYIKFGMQRKPGIFPSYIPNVTIFVVNNTTKHIEKESIRQIL